MSSMYNNTDDEMLSATILKNREREREREREKDRYI